MAKTTFSQGINQALATALEADPNVICFGLGVPDPKGVFGTTLGLQDQFGAERVFDMPTSENGMTGIAIGAALHGLRPVMTHQRLDFALLSMDQLVNNAAKWRFMFGGTRSVPLTVRMILGRGWGQGPTHSQSLQAWFAHVPGLKVVMPASAPDAKGLLLSAIFDEDPVLYLEHRWLHEMQGDVPEGDYRVPLGQASILREGTDLTIVGMSYMVVEALHALDTLEACGISAELVDLRTISPLDWDTVLESVRKTRRIMVLDTATRSFSVSAEIVSRVCEELHGTLLCRPERVALPDSPTPTSPALTRAFYPGAEEIVLTAGRMVGRAVDISALKSQRKFPHDVPGDWFKGPF